MKPIKRQHLVATIFPASMIELVRKHSHPPGTLHSDEVVILRGLNSVSGRRVRLIAEEFARSGKTIRVVRSL